MGKVFLDIDWEVLDRRKNVWCLVSVWKEEIGKKKEKFFLIIGFRVNIKVLKNYKKSKLGMI